MNCTEARQHWNLYHDSEGDAALHFQVSEHLAVCPGCAEWFAKQSRLESLLAEKLARGGDVPCLPTPELWNQVLTRTGLARPAPARGWFLLAGLAACASLLFAGWLWLGNRPPDPAGPDLARLSAQLHQRLVEEGEVVPFHSGSDREVERYLQRHVSFPVRCPPRRDAGFAVQGAGTCKLGDQPTAYILGRVDEALVSVFVLDRDSLAAFPHQQEAVRREKTHRCREGPYEMVMAVKDRNTVLVVGQARPERLERVLDAYGSYPEGHP